MKKNVKITFFSTLNIYLLFSSMNFPLRKAGYRPI